MQLGDLVMFVWPDKLSNVEDPMNWEEARIGIVVEILARRPDDKHYGDELLVLHEGERWSVPELWCKTISSPG